MLCNINSRPIAKPAPTMRSLILSVAAVTTLGLAFVNTARGGTPLWQSSFESRATKSVINGQLAVGIANAVGLPGTAVGAQPLTYLAYGQSATGSAPTAGARQFAISFPDDRTVGIDTGLPSNRGNLSQTLTFEGFFRTPQTEAITSPTYLGRRLVSQKLDTDTTRLAIGLHATGTSNRLGVCYRTAGGDTIMQLGQSEVKPDTWYHFALVYDGSALKWYLNSRFPDIQPTLQGTISNPSLAPAGERTIVVGNFRATGGTDRGYYGLLEEIRISDRALAISEFLCNGGSCPAACEQSVTAGIKWCCGFESEPDATTGDPASHWLAEGGTCGGIRNATGVDGTVTGAAEVAYVAYGQAGIGDAPTAAAGNFAMSFPSSLLGAINTNIPSNAGNLANRLTFVGLFNSASSTPITSPSLVGQRLVTQKRSDSDNETRLAIGLHANDEQTANVLAVFWMDGNQNNNMQVGTTPVLPNTWHTFALIYNGSTLLWYLDGHLEGTASGVSLTGAGGSPLSIANQRISGTASRGFHGLVDEIQLFDSAESFTGVAITQQPSSQSLCVGLNGTLSVAATGDAPLMYRWQKDGQLLSNDGHFAGTNTATLTINNFTSADVGDYRCVVSNYTSTVTSSIAAITVHPSCSATVGTLGSVSDHGGTAVPIAGTGGSVLIDPRRTGIDSLTVNFTQEVESLVDLMSLRVVDDQSTQYAPDSASLENAAKLILEFETPLPTNKLYTLDLADKFATVFSGLTVTDNTTVQVRSLVGDANGDGSINLLDVASIRQNNRQSVSSERAACDLNGDGEINLIDMALARSQIE